LKTAIGRLRVVGFLEGVSFLVLLGIAMPLKYAAGLPEAVLAVGWLHGLLFMLFVAAVVNAYAIGQITFRIAAWAAVASVLPAGTFVLDRSLRRQEPQAPAA
jgi:integral membrane protein